MTVSTTTNKVAYIGNGIATTFAIPFPFLEETHLKVKQLLNNEQINRTDWTISGGNMVFATAPANDAQIVIMREVPLTQETDYRENEVLPAETLERNFDKLTMQVQQLKEQADRAVTVDVFDNSDTDPAILIPSIRQAVSDCARYVATATQKVQAATTQAGYAASSAQAAAVSEQNTAASETHTATMLETKANLDGSNIALNNDAKSYFIRLGMPDFSAGISYGFTGTVTAPSNGFFEVACEAYNNTQGTFSLNGQTVKIAQSTNNSYSSFGVFFVPVSKGAIVHGLTTSNTNNAYIKFYPSIGEV
ncbi:MAG: hypothetical protein IKR09_01485 [Alphaproteobacteria bacterium]|nr:hypothetical protein [Alphaproteobacteria bacterium]